MKKWATGDECEHDGQVIKWEGFTKGNVELNKMAKSLSVPVSCGRVQLSGKLFPSISFKDNPEDKRSLPTYHPQPGSMHVDHQNEQINPNGTTGTVPNFYAFPVNTLYPIVLKRTPEESIQHM